MDESPPEAEFDVRLTPRPAGERDGETRSLNGRWAFADGDASGPPEEGWEPHRVPGEWRREGFEVEGVGWYRRRFSLPRDPSDRRLKLRFDAVYCRARVYVNGEFAGEHDGGYTPFEVDVTGLIKGGENDLVVAVEENSPASDLDWGNVTGGITRDVTLIFVPTCHVARLDVDTELDDGRGVVRTAATVVTEGSTRTGRGELGFELVDPRGRRAAERTREIDLPEPGEEREVEMAIELDAVETWNPEDPTLYDLGFELRSERGTHRIERSVGIRDIEVEGNRLLLNGEPVTLRGVNWEEVHPDHGGAVPPERTRRDAQALREANVNYVRTSHHPPSEAFLSACDELGIVVELEAPLTFLRGEEAELADDPDYRDLVVRQVLEAVERDRSRTAVCLWSLANESAWGENVEVAADRLAERDPTRPTTFNWAEYDDADASHCGVANHHYPATRPDSDLDVEDFAGVDRPVLFGEFAHLFCYADRELATDPGVREDWVRVFEATWERVRAVEACAGAAIWGGTDHVHPTEYRWGLLDRYRRERPEYWHVKKAYAPIRLRDWRVEGSRTRIELANRGRFANLSERAVEWRAGERSGTLDLDAAPGETAAGAIPATPGADGPIEVRVAHPAGFTINEFALQREDATASPPDAAADPAVARDGLAEAGLAVTREDDPGEPGPAVVSESDRVELDTGEATVVVHRRTGDVAVTRDGTTLLDGIGLAVTPLQDDPESPPAYEGAIEHRPTGWTCAGVDVEGTTVRIRGSYDGVEGAFALRPIESGLRVAYDFALRNDLTVRETGLRVTVPATDPTLEWARDARWSAYPGDHVGRPEGSAAAFPDGTRPADDVARLSRDRPWRHDVTRRGSNDFRSTKRDVRWATLRGADGDVCVHADGRSHVRASVREGETDLLVLDRSIAGGGLPFLVRHPLLGEETTIEAGTRLSDRVDLVGLGFPPE